VSSGPAVVELLLLLPVAALVSEAAILFPADDLEVDFVFKTTPNLDIVEMAAQIEEILMSDV
jgi:hypothetical protein